MNVIINGTPKELKDISYLSDIVAQFCKEPKHILTEVNGNIIPPAVWDNTALKDGDTVELVTFVGGG